MLQDSLTNSVQVYTILPTRKFNRPTPPSEVPLHGLDLLSAPIQIRNHRFYHPFTEADKDGIDVCETLKSTLAEALELYPPVAGTVRINKEGEILLVMDIKEQIGTPFITEVKDVAFGGGDDETLSPRHEPVLPPISPSLAVKVTQFSCGTIVVASSLNHQVADLRGFLDFLETWAQLSRGESIDLTRIPDDWSRTPGRFFTGYYKNSSVPPPPPGFKVLEYPSTGPAPYLLAPSEASRWKISKANIERLKHDFSPKEDSNPEQWISSGDAVASLLSGAITRARENARTSRLEGRSLVSLGTEIIAAAADGRGRAPQAMQKKYYGNFNTLFFTTVSRSDLLSLSTESASRVALAIREAVGAQLSPQALADKIAFFEAYSKPAGKIDWSADIILTNWCRFDLRGPEHDLGWGKPFLVTDGGGGPYPPGYVIMTQDKLSGDIDLLMAIEKEGGDELRTDPLLTEYASLTMIL